MLSSRHNTGGDASRFLCWQPRLRRIPNLVHSYLKNVAVVTKVIVAIMRFDVIVIQQWPRVITVVTMCPNNCFGFHCSNNVFQQWSLPIVALVFQQWLLFPSLHNCVGTVTLVQIATVMLVPIFKHFLAMAPGHARCLVPRKNATEWQTGMDGPISFSSFTLERDVN
jgi:hypothetical protein